MADNLPPETVGQLVAKVTAATTNIAKHRAAMAEVAATAKTTTPAQPKGEVNKQ